MRDNGPVTQQEYKLPEGSVIVSRTDKHGNIISANEAFIEASGFDWSELVGQPHNMLRHPDVPAAVFKDFWSTLKKGKPWSQIIKNRRKNGDHYWVIANATPIFENGEITGYISVRTPATDQQISDAEAAYRAIGTGKVCLKEGIVPSARHKFDILAHFNLSSVLLVLCVMLLASAFMPLFKTGIPDIIFEVLDVIFVALILLVSQVYGKKIKQLTKYITRISEGHFDSEINTFGSSFISTAYSRLKSMQIKLGADLDDAKETLNRSQRIESALKSASTNILVADRFNTIIFMNDSIQQMLKQIESQVRQKIPDFDTDHLIRQNIDIFPGHDQQLINKLTSTHQDRIELGSVTIDLVLDPIFNEKGDRIGTVAEWKDMTEQLAIEANIEQIVDNASQGVLKDRIDTSALHGFEKKLSTSINKLLDSFSGIIQDLGHILSSMSDGDLTQRMNTDVEGEILVMKTAINNALKNIEMTFSKIKQGSTEIGNMSNEVSQASNDLSDRTQQQAASLEQTASSMEELTSTVQQSAENSTKANDLSHEAAIEASEGIQVMAKTKKAMEGITEVSQKIGEITNVIDSIAFQTNLLALNAAVEAARAGEHGRGFAVVAGEVRNLAQKTAESSKEINNLISTAIKQIQSGTTMVSETNTVFENMVNKIQEVEGLVQEVSSTTQEQARGINQINTAVMNLDKMTQQNAALVEELSATAGNMSEHANNQATFVGRFRISAGGDKHTEDSLGLSNFDFEDAKQKHRS